MWNALIHWWLSVNWNRSPPFLNCVAMPTATPSVATLKASATRLASSPFSLGSAATAAAPASGTAPSVVNQGKLLIYLNSLQLREQDRGDQGGRSPEHGQGVGADEPGLQPSQAPGGAADQCRQAVDRAVHAAVVGVDQGPRQVL